MIIRRNKQEVVQFLQSVVQKKAQQDDEPQPVKNNQKTGCTKHREETSNQSCLLHR